MDSKFNFTSIEGIVKWIEVREKEAHFYIDSEGFEIYFSVNGKLEDACIENLEIGSRLLVSGRLERIKKVVYIKAKEVNFLDKKAPQKVHIEQKVVT